MAQVSAHADFTYVDAPSPHVMRRRAIVKTHPEVKRLMGCNRWSPAWIAALVVAQWAIGFAASGWHWWWIVLLAYGVGAFFNHALYVMMHECTHNLVARSPSANKVWGIVCDLALAMPSAMAFRKYHLYHHRYLGRYDMDPDVVTNEEARLVGNGAPRKALWIFLLGVSQALRPLKLKIMHGISVWNRWSVANVLLVIVADVLIAVTLGPATLLYLALSTLFALGLHPLGGRWIQEHYVTREGQETYSYYGPLNRLCFNMGYHNEHHDFPNVAWNRLRQLHAVAKADYASLKAYRSWTAVLAKFIFDGTMSGYSRIVRVPEHVPEEAPEVQKGSKTTAGCAPSATASSPTPGM